MDADTPDANVINLFSRASVTSAPLIEDRGAMLIDALETLDAIREGLVRGEYIGFAMVLGMPCPRTGSIVSTASVTTQGAVENSIVFLGGLTRVTHRLNRILDGYDQE